MANDIAERAYRIFSDALNLPTAKRDDWLNEACQADSQLRDEVDALIAADRNANNFLRLDETSIDRLPDLVGQLVAQYRIKERIGEGGMAVVYMAERITGDFEQKVALKMLRVDLGSAQTQIRFDQERQVLAHLEHPYITQLFDGGVTKEGTPYIVMEYVQGTAIDRYCDENQLSIRDRMRLFIKVCDAVAEAHRHLVVHRDIKPSNILVSANGIPKLLDFGIAKLLQDETLGRPLTVEGSRAFTPEFASPEQIVGEPITTASDVYALGALLYRLLVGSAVYAVETNNVYEYIHAISESPPTRASISLQKRARDPSTQNEVREIVKMRSTTLRRLDRLLKGDLDNIVMRALSKEPRERYPSAHEFAGDIRRWLDGRAIHAREPTVGYRLRKYIARNKLVSGLTTLLLLSLLFGAGVSLWQAQLARQERDRARLQADKATQTSEFLQEMLASADPRLGKRDITVAEVLTNAATEADDKLAGQPLLQVDVLNTIGRTYRSLGLFEQSEESLQKALNILNDYSGQSSVEYASLQQELAALLTETGRYSEAEPMFRKALATYKAHQNSEEGYAKTANSLAVLLVNTARTDEAESLYNESIGIYRRLPVANNTALGEVLNNFGLLAGYTGEFQKAEDRHRESIEIMRQSYPPGHPSIVYVLFNLAGAIDFQGRYAEAEPMFREVIAGRRVLLGEDHPDFIWAQVTLGNNLFYQKKMTEAESILREALVKAETAMPETHPLRAFGHIVLGMVLCEGRNIAEGEQQLKMALRLREETLPENHWALVNTRSVLGGCMIKDGQLDAAEPLLLTSLEFQQDFHGLEHEKTVDTINRLISLYEAIGDPERADHFRSLLQE